MTRTLGVTTHPCSQPRKNFPPGERRSGGGEFRIEEQARAIWSLLVPDPGYVAQERLYGVHIPWLPFGAVEE